MRRPHAEFYEKTALKQTKAPDFGDYDVLAQVLPKAKQRGLRVYCWYEDVFRTDIPGVEPLREIDLEGRPAGTLCTLHPDYKNFLIGLTADFCKSYEIDGVMWGSERQGPLNNAIGASHAGRTNPNRVTCFCEHHRRAAKERGIDVSRAIEGFKQLAQFVTAAQAGTRPADGYFVTFWRLLVEYPELLAWEKLWTDGQHAIYQDVYNTAKQSRPCGASRLPHLARQLIRPVLPRRARLREDGQLRRRTQDRRLQQLWRPALRRCDRQRSQHRLPRLATR